MSFRARFLLNMITAAMALLLVNLLWHKYEGLPWLQNRIINGGTILAGAAYLAAALISSRALGKTLRKLHSYLLKLELRDGNDHDVKLPDSAPEVAKLESTLERILENRRAETERLRQLEDYRKEFLGNVSHELKTPIFNIQGYISTLLDGGLEDETVNRDFLQKADRNVERLAGIVSDLETITQYEAGELELQRSEFDITEMMSEVVESLEFQAGRERISLQFQDPGKPIIVCADSFRIRQVLTNLGTNSIRYGKENGISRFKITPMGNKVRIEVADTGLGIPEKDLGRIFERFYRVDKSRSRNKGGSGLGLAIVKHIVEAHGEQIDVMSTEGAGSVFGFSLPIGPC
ncbi:MAG: sensor histidine kinase [Bacteroidetes bacterium]|nr:sensor histidine kinase [Bacteroidota bacterium]